MAMSQQASRHPINQQQVDRATFGQRAAEQMAKVIGSWRFLIIQSCILATWIALNVIEIFFTPWDPYPFILLNLMLSFQAAYTGPILLIASNRAAERDRLLLEHEANEIEQNTQDAKTLKEVLDTNTELTKKVHELTVELHKWMAESRELRASSFTG
jgi:uncharacterized membrane protein